MIIKFHQIKEYIIHYFVAKRNGHGVHSPFAYKLCEEVFYNKNHFYDFENLYKIKLELLNNDTEIIVEDFGAGSHTFKSNKRKISTLTKKGTSKTKQSEILYKIINFLGCKNSLELGTSIGLNTLYLANANKEGKVTSIEGSKALNEFAITLANNANINNIKFICEKFDDALPKWLQEINVIDFLYVDGNHTYEATINYFNLALTKKNNSSVFVFDDIYWSPEMTKAWKEIKKNPMVTITIDTFYFGLVFFKNEVKEKIDLKIFV